MLERLNALEHKMALATKQIVGPKSERMPTPEEEAKKREGKKGRRGGYTNPKKRKENAEALASLPTTIVPHPVPDDERRCGNGHLVPETAQFVHGLLFRRVDDGAGGEEEERLEERVCEQVEHRRADSAYAERHEHQSQ